MNLLKQVQRKRTEHNSENAMSLNPLASKELADKRYALCAVCPHRRENIKGFEEKFRKEHSEKKFTVMDTNSAWNIEKNKCNLYGCYMPAKVKIKDVSCPAKKW